MLVALYLQRVLTMSPERAGPAMVPTSMAGFVVSLAVLPRVLRAIGPRRCLVVGLVVGLIVLAAGQLWIAYGATGSGYLIAVLPACCWSRPRSRCPSRPPPW